MNESNLRKAFYVRPYTTKASKAKKEPCEILEEFPTEFVRVLIDCGRTRIKKTVKRKHLEYV